MKKIKILHKSFSKPISCLTAYSPSIANILDGKIDLILVGDSLGSTLYGMQNTQGVTMDMMKHHGVAVNKEIKRRWYNNNSNHTLHRRSGGNSR